MEKWSFDVSSSIVRSFFRKGSLRKHVKSSSKWNQRRNHSLRRGPNCLSTYTWTAAFRKLHQTRVTQSLSSKFLTVDVMRGPYLKQPSCFAYLICSFDEIVHWKGLMLCNIISFTDITIVISTNVKFLVYIKNPHNKSESDLPITSPL